MSAAAAAGWRELAAAGFMGTVGPLLARRREDGGWIYAIEARDDHLNPAGLVHGGVLTSLADHAMSLVAWEAAGRRPVVTMQLSSAFVEPARAGERLEAQAEVEWARTGTLFVSCRVESQRGRVMLANGIWKIAGKPATDNPGSGG